LLRLAGCAIAAVVWTLPLAARATTVDGILFLAIPSSEVDFHSGTGAIEYVFSVDCVVLSDGRTSCRGAGTTQRSSPILAAVAIEANLQTLTFSADPAREYLTRILRWVPELDEVLEIELDFLALRIEGLASQSTGQLIGSARLVSDGGELHATAPVGSVIPILASVELLDGAVFGPDLVASDFTFALDGAIDLAVPEPTTRLLLGLGLVALAARARRGKKGSCGTPLGCSRARQVSPSP
jgi:hypothetical protein